jgi:hypothetical protein
MSTTPTQFQLQVTPAGLIAMGILVSGIPFIGSIHSDSTDVPPSSKLS